MNTSKHLTLQDRQNIELMLNAKKDFTEIAQAIGKHKSTISREIKAHVAYIRIGAKGVAYNNCKNRYGCQKTNVCTKCNSPQRFRLCHRCSICNFQCPDFEKDICPRHTTVPPLTTYIFPDSDRRTNSPHCFPFPC